MRKGGYKIVDFKGAELSSTVVVRPGFYSQIIDDYDKTILVSGVSLGGSLKDDSFASVSEVTGDSGDSVNLGVYGGVITVTEDDEVTFTLSSTPAELDGKIEEVDGKIEEVDGKVGDLDELETTDKDSLVDAVNEVNTSLSNKISYVEVNDTTPVNVKAKTSGLVTENNFLCAVGKDDSVICLPYYNLTQESIYIALKDTSLVAVTGQKTIRIYYWS